MSGGRGSLLGGGMHSIPGGGTLGRHRDFGRSIGGIRDCPPSRGSGFRPSPAPSWHPSPHWDRSPHWGRPPHHHYRPYWYDGLGFAIGALWGWNSWYGWYGPNWYYGYRYPRYYYSSWDYYPYYYRDYWWNSGWHYSRFYYDGWRLGWYGGFSYTYNPWPVYRAAYYYPTTTVVYEQPVVTAYTPVSTSSSTVQPVTYAAPAPETVVTETAAPAVEIPCGCACGCNGVRPCVCSYQCGEEYSFYGDDFDIETSFTSYAESLNPEQIWSSYARLDDLWGIE